MKRLFLVPLVVALLLVALSCGGEEAEVIAPQPSITASPEVGRGHPTVTVVAAERTAAPIAPPRSVKLSWDEAISHIGEEGTVCGPVVHAEYLSQSAGQPTQLAIGESYLDPEHFTVVVWGQDRDSFAVAPEDAYLGQTVCVTGLIEPNEQAAKMTVRSPGDIVVSPTPSALPTAPASATPKAAASNTPQPTVTPSPDFSPFAEQWGRHGFGITVTASGEATATWRVYKWCSDDPTPPCDDMTDSEIVNGGHATIIFDRVVGETAYGLVRDSTDELTLSGSVALTLQPYDMASLESIDRPESEPIVLCGPNYWQEAPDSLKQQSPCGA
jgi:hypothetical protein